MRLQLLGNRIEQQAGSLRMGQLPATHADHHLHLVARFEELSDALHLRRHVVVAHVRPEADLLKGEGLLRFVGFALPLALLELKPPIVEQFADRWGCRRIDFDEVQFAGSCEVESLP